MDSTYSVVNPDEPFLNRKELCELINVCDENSPDLYERYIELRFDEGNSRQMFTHDEAMLVLIEDVLIADCLRLKAAGGTPQEIADLTQTFFNAGCHMNPIDEYIHLRCARSYSAEKAFVSICEEYGIDHGEHSAAKQRDELLSFMNP